MASIIALAFWSWDSSYPTVGSVRISYSGRLGILPSSKIRKPAKS